MSTTTPNDDYLDYRVSYYDKRLAQLVADLRALADRVEREGVPNTVASVDGTPRYLRAAETVNHTIVWGIANAGAHRLMNDAYHADQAEAAQLTTNPEGS